MRRSTVRGLAAREVTRCSSVPGLLGSSWPNGVPRYPDILCSLDIVVHLVCCPCPFTAYSIPLDDSGNLSFVACGMTIYELQCILRARAPYNTRYIQCISYRRSVQFSSVPTQPSFSARSSVLSNHRVNTQDGQPDPGNPAAADRREEGCGQGVRGQEA